MTTTAPVTDSPSDQPSLSAHTCAICNLVAKNTSDLDNHTLKYHLQGINCPECDFTCKSQEEIKNHREESHNVKCMLCGFTALNSLVLNEHTKTTHKFNYSCETCEFTCPVKDDMALHVNSMHKTRVKKKIFPCDSCDDVFGESQGLSEHKSCHNQEPSEHEETMMHKFLRVLAMQQEVIIKKLEKLETVMEHDLPELKSQQEAIRVEVSEAMKASTKHGNT